jgi:hypothetical protein
LILTLSFAQGQERNINPNCYRIQGQGLLLGTGARGHVTKIPRIDSVECQESPPFIALKKCNQKCEECEQDQLDLINISMQQDRDWNYSCLEDGRLILMPFYDGKSMSEHCTQRCTRGDRTHTPALMKQLGALKEALGLMIRKGHYDADLADENVMFLKADGSVKFIDRGNLASFDKLIRENLVHYKKCFNAISTVDYSTLKDSSHTPHHVDEKIEINREALEAEVAILTKDVTTLSDLKRNLKKETRSIEEIISALNHKILKEKINAAIKDEKDSALESKESDPTLEDLVHIAFDVAKAYTKTISKALADSEASTQKKRTPIEIMTIALDALK